MQRQANQDLIISLKNWKLFGGVHTIVVDWYSELQFRIPVQRAPAPKLVPAPIGLAPSLPAPNPAGMLKVSILDSKKTVVRVWLSS
jgi:hypothetical protein